MQGGTAAAALEVIVLPDGPCAGGVRSLALLLLRVALPLVEKKFVADERKARTGLYRHDRYTGVEGSAAGAVTAARAGQLLCHEEFLRWIALYFVSIRCREDGEIPSLPSNCMCGESGRNVKPLGYLVLGR